MFHGTLTLLTRSLRLDALQLRAHSFRVISAGLVMLLLLITHIETSGIGSPGLRFFTLTCHLGIGLITVAGAGLFSTAITEEKEAGTLNLLLMANVPPIAILVGKSTTRIASVLLVFAGIFPFALLALALGGATAHQVWSGLVALAAYMVLVANLGLFASVVRRTGSGAAVITTGLLLVLLLGPFLMAKVSQTLLLVGWSSPGSALVTTLEGWAKTLDGLSVVRRVKSIQRTGFAESAWSPQVLWSLALSGLLFGLSWTLFRRFCEYLPENVPPRTGVLKIRGGVRRSLGRRLLTPRAWSHALTWKEFQFLGSGVVGLLGRLVLVPVIAVGFFTVDRLLGAGMNLRAADALRLSLLIVAGLEAVAMSARVFSAEYRQQTLCTLVLLPRSTMYLCYSKVAGCLLVLIPFVLWFFALGSQFAIESRELSRFYLVTSQSVTVGCLTLVLMHLTAYFSLCMKWGALPLSLMLLMVISTVLSPFVALVSSTTRNADGTEASLISPVLYLTFVICGALQIATGLRFRRAAAE